MSNYEGILESALADHRNTAINLPKAAVNQIIRQSYQTDESFIITRSQLWDMEDEKAHHPDKYLRHIVRPGSLEIFDHRRQGSLEFFTRISDQRLWKNPSKFTTVIEHVGLDHEAQRAFFIGARHAETPDGRNIVAGEDQPLFHVEHSVEGSADAPLNVWRIVHLTDGIDNEMLSIFQKMGQSPYLREFVEVYIQEDLGKKLIRKEIPI